MKKVSILSWNINGIRAAHKKGFLSWLSEIHPDIVCLQEIRANSSQLDDILAKPLDYFAYWNSAKKTGYGGTALLSRKEPISVKYGIGNKSFDQEGRTIIAEYSDFTLINCYFPNGNRNQERLQYKLKFYDTFLKKCQKMQTKGHKIIFCGDLNTAHTEIDLIQPKANNNRSGFLPEERNRINKMIKAGYTDTFRHFYPYLTGQYTWWPNKLHFRKQNKGWRFDYLFVDEEIIKHVLDAFILPEVAHSDHCPIGIFLETQGD